MTKLLHLKIIFFNNEVFHLFLCHFLMNHSENWHRTSSEQTKSKTVNWKFQHLIFSEFSLMIF